MSHVPLVNTENSFLFQETIDRAEYLSKTPWKLRSILTRIVDETVTKSKQSHVPIHTDFCLKLSTSNFTECKAPSSALPDHKWKAWPKLPDSFRVSSWTRGISTREKETKSASERMGFVLKFDNKCIVLGEVQTIESKTSKHVLLTLALIWFGWNLI